MTPFWRRLRKTIYYITRVVGTYLPEIFFRKLKFREIAYLDRRDPCVEERVDYYNKLGGFTQLKGSSDLRKLRKEKKTAYFFDLYEFARYFEPDRKFCYRFGDVVDVPPQPTFVKSRPIEGDNSNSVLLSLNKVRHQLFVRDPYPYDEKNDILVWRGEVCRPRRKRFVQQFAGKSGFDVGQVNLDPEQPDLWRPYLSIKQQLKHKFVFSIEGNDVATSLKWTLSSNSLCLMSKPRFETWFMEGKLAAGEHYVLVKDDFSDLEKQVEYYASRPREAKEIVANANRFVSQFLDPALEWQVSLLVIEKYFKHTG